MAWHIPPGVFRGIGGLDLAALGIPSEREYVRRYCERTGRGDPDARDGRLELLPGLQPVPPGRDHAGHRQARRRRHRRQRAGARRRATRRAALAQHGLAQFAQRRADTSRRGDTHGLRLLTAHAGAAGAGSRPSWTSTSIRPRRAMPTSCAANTEAGKRWTPLQTIEELKPKARAAGLWNLFLPDSELGAGLTNQEYAPLAEIMGRVPWAQRGVQLLGARHRQHGGAGALRHARAARSSWLEPLLAGEIRSAFAMTEPAVASSDATNIESRIERDGDDYVINGRKWWTSRRRRPALQDHDLHGQDRPGGAAPLAAVDDPGAVRHAGRQGDAAAVGVRLRRCAARPHGGRLQGRARAGLATCCSAKAAASRSRRAASGPGASTTACA